MTNLSKISTVIEGENVAAIEANPKMARFA